MALLLGRARNWIKTWQVQRICGTWRRAAPGRISRTLKTTTYWIATAVLTVMLLLGGLLDLAHASPVIQTLAALGYPPFLASILGAWKLLGAAAIATPGLPRLKEWAYAGVVFELSGAAASHAFAGDPAGKIAVPLVLLAFAALSWALRPATRRMGEVLPGALVPPRTARARAA
ncbi:MAG TPA: DoxX family protein [Myxococcaceae bacterium]|nr:DoxX family protein [Myxococcaceae bacterium]